MSTGPGSSCGGRRRPYGKWLRLALNVTAPTMRWMFSLALLPNEIETLKAGNRVTRTYPEPIPNGPLPFLPEDLEALKSGKSLTKLTPSMSPPFLGNGDIVSVMSSEGLPEPPAVLPEDLEAVRAGETVTRISTAGRPPSEMSPDQRKREIERLEAEHAKLLRVKVVEYRRQGQDHTYTFEAVKAGDGGLTGHDG